MKIARSFVFLLLLECWLVAFCQSESQQFFLVLLKRPANPPQLSKEAGEQLQNEHMANIRKMYSEGRLVIAGPFSEDSDLRGIFVLKAASVGQAQQWAAEDPAVKAGRLKAEVHGPWLVDADMIHKPAPSNDLEQYSFVIFRRGSTHAGAGDEKSAINQLAGNEQSALGGTFADAAELRAVVVYVAAVEQAQKLAHESALVQSGALQVEVHPWLTGKGVLKSGQPFHLN